MNIKTYNEFLVESAINETKSIDDSEGSLKFGLSKNADGVFFQIGNERFQTSKYSKAAVEAVLKSGGKWKGKEGTKEIGIAVDGGMAYFKIGDEQFIMSARGRKELAKLYK